MYDAYCFAKRGVADCKGQITGGDVIQRMDKQKYVRAVVTITLLQLMPAMWQAMPGAEAPGVTCHQIWHKGVIFHMVEYLHLLHPLKRPIGVSSDFYQFDMTITRFRYDLQGFHPGDFSLNGASGMLVRGMTTGVDMVALRGEPGGGCVIDGEINLDSIES
jgi:hypothetical protein